MQKIKIRLPATLTEFGPGLGSLGLALSLYAHVEISPRSDDQLIVETDGEGAGRYAVGLRHPVVLGMMRVFQTLEDAPPGMTVRVQNDIPLQSGLGAETAFTVAGIVGANNLMGQPFRREHLVTLAAQHSQRPHGAVAAMLGGLTATLRESADETPNYRALRLESFRVIVAVPRRDSYTPPPIPESIDRAQALANLGRLPLLLEALREGDLHLLVPMLEDHILQPTVRQRVPGYAHVVEMARLAGALGTTSSGGGPAMIIFAERGHDRIAEVVETAFTNLKIPALVRVLNVDTQGIVISMLQSA